MRLRYRWRDILASAADLTPSFGYRWPSEVGGHIGVREPNPLDCCGDALFWCMSTGQMECEIHSGFAKCCSRPDRHVPISRFEERARLHLYELDYGPPEHLTVQELEEAAQRYEAEHGDG